MIRLTILALLAAFAGCFDSLVSGPCATGYAFVDGHCVAGGGPDAGAGAPDADVGSDGGERVPEGLTPDVLACPAPTLACHGACIDVAADPDNCGACGHVCASGLCTAGHCEGELSGHIVTIGHDYRSHHAAMARVLGNAAALGRHHDIALARWRGTSSSAASTGTTAALASALIAIGRPWHAVALPAQPSPTALAGVDVLVIEAQLGDGDAAAASGAAWATAIDQLLQAGGIVVLLEGAGGTTHRFAAGANLYAIEAPVDTTDAAAYVVAAGDALAHHVVSPYLAELSSVGFPGVGNPVVATASGATIVFHLTRY